MKKKFFGFLTAILTLGVLGGTATLVANNDIQREDHAKAAETTRRYYVDISYPKDKGFWWANGTIGYCFKEKDKDNWPTGNCTKVSGVDNLYYVDLPSSIDGLEFTTYGGGSDQNKTKWFTSDLDKNYYYINSTNNNGTQSCLVGYYNGETSYTETSRIKTTRVWAHVDTNGDDNGLTWWNNDNASTKIRYWDSNNKTYFVTPKEISSEEGKYYYADIGLNATGYQVVRTYDKGATSFIFNYAGEWQYSQKDTAGEILYVYKNDDNSIGSSIGSLSEDNATVEICLAALEGVLTCSDSKLNGSGCYANIKNNFIDKLSASDFNTFKNETITDYNGEEFVSYDNHDESKAEYTVAKKLEILDNKILETKFNSAFNNNNSAFILIIILGISVSILCFVVLKKKRQIN